MDFTNGNKPEMGRAVEVHVWRGGTNHLAAQAARRLAQLGPSLLLAARRKQFDIYGEVTDVMDGSIRPAPRA
jgi:hypothetical protein